MEKDSPKLKITKFCATIKIDIFMEDCERQVVFYSFR